MSDALDRLREQYVALVEACLTNDDEVALCQAYELGRRALHEGIGILDAASLQRDALTLLTRTEHARDAAHDARIIGRAELVFREFLSPYEMTFRVYRDANAELQRLNQSLTQQKEAVEFANRELESFSYSVSHDLRAPLRSIDGFSQALLEDYGEALDAQAKRYLQNVRESAQRMAQLIDDLLSLARVTRSELVWTRVELNVVARRVVDRLRAGEPERHVEVVIAEAMSAAGDPRLLEVVLDNLLANAWKFTAKCSRPRIEIGQRSDEGQLVYFIKDNGAGFDMAYSAKLFGVFQRLHRASEFEGTGIGLATVQRIIHRHGGKVWAEGEVDRGATFSFTLGDGKSDG